MISGKRPQSAPERMMNGGKPHWGAETSSNTPDEERIISLSSCGADLAFSKAIEKGMSLDIGKRYKTVEQLSSAFSKRFIPRKYYVIAGGALAAIVLVGLIILVVNLVGAKKDNTDGKPINSKGAEETEKDINDDEEKVFTEEELAGIIESAIEQRIAFSCYEDFDNNGSRELFALTMPQNVSEDGTNEKGQIWFADSEGNVSRVMNTKTGSTYTYSGDSKHGLLHFDEATHFYLESQSDENTTETISFGIVDGNPKLIYQGNAQFIEYDDGIYIENRYMYDYFNEESFTGSCKVLFMEGQYFGCGLSPMSLAQFNSIPGLTDELEKAKNQLSAIYNLYSYHFFEDVYYSADDCIYVIAACFRSVEDHEDYEHVGYSNSKRELEDIDYIKCALVFSRQSESFFFNEIREKLPAETTTLALFYKTADFWNQGSIDTGNMSDEEAKEVLMNRLYEHFRMQDEEFGDSYKHLIWGEDSELISISDSGYQSNVSQFILGDFNNDGSKELIGYINIFLSNWNPFYGIYYIGNDGIVTMCQEKGIFAGGIDGFDEITFGKKQMYCFTVSQQLYSETFLYEPCDGGVVRYDQLWSTGYNSLSLGQGEDGVVYLAPYWDVVYNDSTGKIGCGGINQLADSFIDSAQIWFVDEKFVECASIRIDESDFCRLIGSRDIIDHIDEYAVKSLGKSRFESFYGAVDTSDFGIESILYCGDGYIYINYLPLKNYSKYEYGMPSVVIKVAVEGNEVSVSDTYLAYKMDRLTNFQPYYPQSIDFLEADNNVEEQSSELSGQDSDTQTGSTVIRGGDVISVQVIVDDYYQFSYGKGKAIILKLDEPIDIIYKDVDGTEYSREDFSDNLFVISDDATEGGWDQYNGKYIKCRVNGFMWAASGGMIADVSEIVEVVE